MSGKVNKVQSTIRSLELVDELLERDGARVSELADAVEFSKGSVYNHLQTLKDQGYIVQDGDIYRLSLRFLTVGEQVRTQTTLYQMVKPSVKELAERTGDRASFCVEENGEGVFVFTEKGHRAKKTSFTGRRTDLHTQAAGKMILSHLPEDRLEEILDERKLTPQTEYTITDREELLSELAVIREQGVAFNDEEAVNGLRAVAVPVWDKADNIAGAISVAGSTSRFDEERFTEYVPSVLKSVADEIRLQHYY